MFEITGLLAGTILVILVAAFAAGSSCVNTAELVAPEPVNT
jgi:hypothetical protein